MIILLSGQDSYRISQKLNKYKERFLRDVDPSGINIEMLDGGEVTVESFRRAVLSGGLFVKKRLVIINNLFAKCKDRKVIDELTRYIKSNDNDENKLFFVETLSNPPSSQIDKKPKTPDDLEFRRRVSDLFETLKKNKFSESLNLLNGAKLFDWIKKETESRGGKITQPVVRFLAAEVGSDLWQMSNEIDKLIAYAYGREILLEEAKSLVVAKFDENIFKLTDAISCRDKAVAVRLFGEQLRAGSPFPRILATLAWQVRVLLQVKSAPNLARNQGTLAKSLGLHPYVCQKALAQTKNFSLESLKKFHDRLLKLEVETKTSNLNPELLFDLLAVA